MKCLQHPDEDIRCINIDPAMHDRRFLCFDCYVEALSRGVPQSHLPKIQDVFIIIRRSFGILVYYSLQIYKVIEALKKYRAKGMDTFQLQMQCILCNQEFNKIKDIVRATYDQIMKYLDEYTDQIQQLWQGYDELHDSVWQYLKYPITEIGLQEIITLKNSDEEQYKVILDDVNSLFNKIHLNQNQEFADNFQEITMFSQKIRNIDIISDWKSHLKPLKQALGLFMEHHEQIFSFKNKDNKITKDQLYEQISQLKYKCQPRKCVICMDMEAQYASTPCGHLSYCQNCKSTIFNKKQCAVCKQQVNSMYRIYTS